MESKKRVWKIRTQDIANAVGLTAPYIRKEIRAGRIRPDDLVSLSEYIVGSRILESSRK